MNKIFDYRYICNDCAIDSGATWPKHHAATFHEGKCDICAKIKSLSNVGDWDWPDGIRRGMRD